MTTWKVYLTVNDRINNRKSKLKFNFPPLYRYKTLYNNLPILLQTIGWSPIIYHPSYVTFKFGSYRDTPIKVDDWDNFILNRDKIHIIIFDPRIYSYALFTENGKKIMQTTKIETIYEDIKIEMVHKPLLLYKVNITGAKIELIDVIDNPIRHYNDVVNRLIQRYG